MILLVGLGNPSSKHANNRHNIGFAALDRIVERHRFSAYRRQHRGLLAEGRLDRLKVLALKPMTYMNESGQSVGQALRYYKIDATDVVVFHDELDLVAGKMRVKIGGGHAGHNGLRSLDDHIGKGYRRVRLGIGHPGDKGRVLRHVLGDFAKADQAWLEPFLDAIADAAPLLARGDDPGFATRVALLLNPPENHRSKPAANTGDGGQD
jgi:PTH1 family peptidyl-tRNA hydrolase